MYTNVFIYIYIYAYIYTCIPYMQATWSLNPWLSENSSTFFWMYDYIYIYNQLVFFEATMRLSNVTFDIISLLFFFGNVCVCVHRQLNLFISRLLCDCEACLFENFSAVLDFCRFCLFCLMCVCIQTTRPVYLAATMRQSNDLSTELLPRLRLSPLCRWAIHTVYVYRYRYVCI